MSGGGSSRTIAPSDTNAAELLHRATSVVSGFLCVYVAFERGVVPGAEKAGGAGALLCVGVCVGVCVCQRRSQPRWSGAAPSHLELSPDVAVHRTLNYTDHRWDLFS